MLRFAYSTLNWGGAFPLETTLEVVANAGWRSLEFFTEPLDWFGPHTRVRDALERAELKAATLFGNVTLPGSSDHLDLHRRRIDFAAELGAEAYGLIGDRRLRWRPPDENEYADLARTCEAIARHGAERGVTVAYHPHVACTIETRDEIDALMAATETLTLCLDASHIALVDEDPLEHLRTYRDRLGFVHLKDWARGAFTELGEGSLGIDFPAILKYLDDSRFGGWTVVEQSRSNVSPQESARFNAAYLTRLGYDLS